MATKTAPDFFEALACKLRDDSPTLTARMPAPAPRPLATPEPLPESLFADA